jgi:hypothetical protein
METLGLQDSQKVPLIGLDDSASIAARTPIPFLFLVPATPINSGKYPFTAG